MDISLSPDIEKFLNNQIAAGIYKTINDAINGTIRIVISEYTVSENQIHSLKADIEKGLEDVKEGKINDGLAFLDKLISEYDAKKD